MDREAENAAARLLERVWGDDIPVDPARIARALSVQVLEAPLGDDVSGTLMKRRGGDPKIVLNSADSANRKRFTCAHELGHFVKRSEDLEEYEYIDFRDSLSATGQSAKERFANSFAAALLMPEKAVRQYNSAGLDEIELALCFGVSREAMHYRLKNLCLL